MYSGSQDGRVYIYDLSGKIIQTLSTSMGSVVRDVSWHPLDTQLVAASWDGTLYKFDSDR